MIQNVASNHVQSAVTQPYTGLFTSGDKCYLDDVCVFQAGWKFRKSKYLRNQKPLALYHVTKLMVDAMISTYV